MKRFFNQFKKYKASKIAGDKHLNTDEKIMLKRKSPLYYQIVYEYMGTKRYEDVKLKTLDRNEAILHFLELFRMKQSGSLNLDHDCTVNLIVEINMYIRSGFNLSQYSEDDNLQEILDNTERRLTTSYDKLRYTIKIANDSNVFKNYKPIFQTENRNEAIEKFLDFFKKKQLNSFTQESISNVVLEVAISPFDNRCLYLEFIKEESDIFSRLIELEKTVIDSFTS